MVPRSGDIRSDDYDGHMSRLDAIVARWQRGEISVHAKRQQIAAENDRYYHGPAKGEGVRDLTAIPRVRDEAVLTLASSEGIPVEAASAALDAWRSASWAADHADDLRTAQRLRERGRDVYLDILRAAR